MKSFLFTDSHWTTKAYNSVYMDERSKNETKLSIFNPNMLFSFSLSLSLYDIISFHFIQCDDVAIVQTKKKYQAMVINRKAKNAATSREKKTQHLYEIKRITQDHLSVIPVFINSIPLLMKMATADNMPKQPTKYIQ